MDTLIGLLELLAWAAAILALAAAITYVVIKLTQALEARKQRGAPAETPPAP